jgi:hypothetical protein
LLVSLQVAAAIALPKSVSWDPSYGILAAKQYADGKSPSLVTLVQADPGNISQSKSAEVRYWAPCYQIVPYLLRFRTFSWGSALKITTIVILLSAAIGWYQLFKLLSGDARLAWLLLAAMFASRYAWQTAVEYRGGDSLLWAAAPWMVVLCSTAVSAKRLGLPLALLAGLFCGAVFLLKYSGVFMTVGLVLAFCVAAACHRQLRGRAVAFSCGVALVLVPISLANSSQRGTPIRVTGLHPQSAILHLGLAALGPTDLHSLGVKVSGTLKTTTTPVPVLGLGLSLLAAASVVVSRRARGTETTHGIDRTHASTSRQYALVFASAAALCDLFLLAMTSGLGSNIDCDGRHGKNAGLLLLPLLAAGWLRLCRGKAVFGYWLGTVCFAVFLVVPAAYGTVSAIPTYYWAWRASETAVAEDGIVNQHLQRGTNARAFYDEVARRADQRACLYTIYPQMLFPLAERTFIVEEAEELFTADGLAARRFHGTPSGGVAVLVPKEFESNGKLLAIQRCFADATDWRATPILSDRKWALWLSRAAAEKRPEHDFKQSKL